MVLFKTFFRSSFTILFLLSLSLSLFLSSLFLSLSLSLSPFSVYFSLFLNNVSSGTALVSGYHFNWKITKQLTNATTIRCAQPNHHHKLSIRPSFDRI
uniref:Putative secreted peptide n=1 Tax=Anopheles braziliensis TaxID=58242 RepID=A0A2M3ZMC5_9DIPT